MCVNYRKLNAIAIKDKYSVPRIDGQIDRLGNMFFIGLDLASGYYQVPMAEDLIEKTASATQDRNMNFYAFWSFQWACS